jgi:D-sedoheptulose 7-phosphate isomerase
MKKQAHSYFNDLADIINAVTVTGNGDNTMSLDDGIEAACALISRQMSSPRKLMFIGNGASAAISSHMSTDFWKNGGIRAVAFNDPSLLTCVGNMAIDTFSKNR